MTEIAQPRTRIGTFGSNNNPRTRFDAKTQRSEGCWFWLGPLYPKGYGSFWYQGRNVGAHRAAYELFVGPVPPGLSVCHRCDVPCCVNPEHLFLGTARDNLLDASAKGRLPAQQKTHCCRGHQFTPENTYIEPKRGNRKCRTCVKEYWRSRR